MTIASSTFDELAGRLDATAGPSELIACFHAIASGFGGIGFVASAYLSDDYSRILLYASQAQPFQSLDAEGPWWTDDPIAARLAAGEMRPFSYEEAWSDPLPSAAPRWNALVAAGLDSGIVFPTSRPPYAGGVLVFAGPEPSQRDALKTNAATLHLLATYMHAAIVDLAPDKDTDGIIRNSLPSEAIEGKRFKLSERERDCLRWLALGKTAQDIADIEQLSVHTVRSYLRKAMEKLNASTQAQAIARAIKHAIIRP